MLDLAELSVCFIAGTLGQGGAERQLFYTLRTLKESGANVRVLTLTPGQDWERPIRELGIPVIWVGQSRLRIVRLIRITQELRRLRPDVIQSQHFYTNFYAGAAARLLRIREIGTIRGDTVSDIRANGAVLGHLSLHTPRTVTANTRVALRAANGLGVPSERLHYFPNVVDTDRFRPASRSDTSYVRLLAVGRLTQQKRFDRFLVAVARLIRETDTEIQAVIVGAGAARLQLEKQAAELGLFPDVVSLTGNVSDMVAVYRNADVFVLTSDWEGMPNVVLEAMAAGLPVVATAVGGVPEIVRDGDTGYLVAPEDEDALIRSLLHLVTKPERRGELGIRAREFVEDKHSVTELPMFLSNLYSSVLHNGGRQC